VSTATAYGLDRSGNSIPSRDKRIFSTGPGAQAVLHPSDTAGWLPWEKKQEREAGLSAPPSTGVKNAPVPLIRYYSFSYEKAFRLIPYQYRHENISPSRHVIASRNGVQGPALYEHILRTSQVSMAVTAEVRTLVLWFSPATSCATSASYNVF
jgi:hypothetical protein